MRKVYIMIGFLITMSLSGCTFCTKSTVRQVLKERYDQDFTITEYSHYFFPNILWQEGTDTYMAYPDNDPDKPVYRNCCFDERGRCNRYLCDMEGL